MIVRSNRNGELLLISQPDHAVLASVIISQWHPDAFAPPGARATVLQAIHEHDNGWIELDNFPALNPETGKPFDFITAPDDYKKQIWPRGVERLARSSPAAAALVAEHALTLHHRRRAEPGWEQFFTTLDALRSKLLAECKANHGEARAAFDRNYDLLHLGDLLSLIFCNGWVEPIDSRGYHLALAGNHISIAPDPFRGASIRFAVTARAIPDRVYQTSEELQQVFREGATVMLEGSASGR